MVDLKHQNMYPFSSQLKTALKKFRFHTYLWFPVQREVFLLTAEHKEDEQIPTHM